jgi:hypothetical protein
MQIIRKDISFAQAEGFEPLPSQLKRNEVSQNLRVKVHAIIYKSIETDTRSGFEGRYIVGNWAEIIRDLHVSSGGYIDKFKNDFGPNNQLIKSLIQSDNYIIFFDFIERIIKHKLCPNNLREQIDNALRDCGAAYRIIENCVQPITSPEEIQAIKRAINATSDDRFLGARTHLV